MESKEGSDSNHIQEKSPVFEKKKEDLLINKSQDSGPSLKKIGGRETRHCEGPKMDF